MPGHSSRRHCCVSINLPDAAFSAMRETGLPLTTFPTHCPYAPSQVLEQNWLPGEE